MVASPDAGGILSDASGAIHLTNEAGRYRLKRSTRDSWFFCTRGSFALELRCSRHDDRLGRRRAFGNGFTQEQLGHLGPPRTRVGSRLTVRLSRSSLRPRGDTPIAKKKN